MIPTTEYRAQVLREVNALPEEYLPYVLQLVQTFRDSITLKPAAESFKQGWHEAQTQKIIPLDELWDGIDAEVMNQQHRNERSLSPTNSNETFAN